MVPDWTFEGWGHLCIIDHVGRFIGRYPESLMKIWHDLDIAWIGAQTQGDMINITCSSGKCDLKKRNTVTIGPYFY